MILRIYSGSEDLRDWNQALKHSTLSGPSGSHSAALSILILFCFTVESRLFLCDGKQSFSQSWVFIMPEGKGASLIQH